MHIKFINRGTGSTKSAVKYLLAKKDHKGKERPVVRVMHGDPDFIADLGDSLDFKHRYRSAVISWHPDDKVTDEQKREVLEAFERYAYAGLDPSRYAFLAVDHGDHIHIIAPRVELTTGKSLNIAPPGWQKYFDPLRDYFNEKYGWKSPDVEAHPENKRTVSFDPYKLPKKVKEAKELLHNAIVEEIEAGTIRSREDIEEFFKDMNGEITRRGDNYISVKLPGFKKAMRFKGGIYERGALERLGRENQEEERGGAQSDRESNDRALAKLLDGIEENAKRRAEFNQKRYGGDEKRDGELLIEKWLELERSDNGVSVLSNDRIHRSDDIRQQDKNNTAIEHTGSENGERDSDKTGGWEYVVRRQDELAAYRASKSVRNRKREMEMRKIVNDPNELNRWKREVNLVEVAREHGYEIVKEKSTDTSLQLTNGADKIVVSKNPDNNQWRYYKMHTGEGGSVIDFLQNENPGMSLGEVRKYLREWNGESLEPWEYLERDKGNVERKGDERERIEYIWDKTLGGGLAGTIIKDDDEEHRGIPTDILQSLCYSDRTIYKGGDEQSLYFKLFDEGGNACGIAKHTLKGEKRLIKGSKKGVWTDRKGIGEASRIVIAESPIDAISYRILDGTDVDYLIATMGELSGTTKKILESIGKKGGFRGKEIILAFDNDEAGERFTEEVKEIVEKYGGKPIREKPANKDFNDDLKLLAKKSNNAIGMKGEEEFNPAFTKHVELIHEGYFVKTYKNTGYTLIANKEKGVKIVDKKDKIVAQGENFEEQARIMIDMAIEKGWDLRKVEVTGSEEFKEITYKLIEERLGESSDSKTHEYERDNDKDNDWGHSHTM